VGVPVLKNKKMKEMVKKVEEEEEKKEQQNNKMGRRLPLLSVN